MKIVASVIADVVGYSSSYTQNVLGARLYRILVPSAALLVPCTGYNLRISLGRLDVNYTITQAYFGIGQSTLYGAGGIAWKFDGNYPIQTLKYGGATSFTVSGSGIDLDPFPYTTSMSRNLLLSFYVYSPLAVTQIPAAYTSFYYCQYYADGDFSNLLDPVEMTAISQRCAILSKIQIVTWSDATGAITLSTKKGRGYQLPAAPAAPDDRVAVGFQDIVLQTDSTTASMPPFARGTFLVTGSATAHMGLVACYGTVVIKTPYQGASGFVGAICSGSGTIAVIGSGKTNLIATGVAELPSLSGLGFSGALAAGTISVLGQAYALAGIAGRGLGELTLEGLGFTGAVGTGVIKVHASAAALTGIIGHGSMSLSDILGSGHGFTDVVGKGTGIVQVYQRAARGIVGTVAHGDGTFSLVVVQADGNAGIVGTAWAEIVLEQESSSTSHGIVGNGSGTLVVTQRSDGSGGSANPRRFMNNLWRYDRKRASGGS